MNIKESYSIFARFYDEYMEHVDYDLWVNFVLGQYNHHHLAGAGKILELACGTGNIATRLVKRGFDVEATDLSAEMIEIAKAKPFAAKFKQANMLEKLPTDKYSLVLLLFDSLNYLQDQDDITLLFNNVSESLKETGIFIFDVSTEKNCLDNFDGFLNIDDEDDSFLVHQSFYIAEEMIQQTHLTLFDKTGDSYKRFDEWHNQKIYMLANIKELISESKLKLLGIYRLAGKEGVPIPDEEQSDADQCFTRLYFICGADNA